MNSETDNSIPISALQHMAYCARQAALIHVERIWHDDRNTALGKVVHENFDISGKLSRRGVEIVHRMFLVSHRLGVTGFADMVELHRDAKAPFGLRPVPVEAKKGRVKALRADEIQLCAQAMALEERFGVDVPTAALYYDASHRRKIIAIDQPLRDETLALANEMRRVMEASALPSPVYQERKCSRCSLESACMPQAARSATAWIKRLANP